MSNAVHNFTVAKGQRSQLEAIAKKRNGYLFPEEDTLQYETESKNVPDVQWNKQLHDEFPDVVFRTLSYSVEAGFMSLAIFKDGKLHYHDEDWEPTEKNIVSCDAEGWRRVTPDSVFPKEWWTETMPAEDTKFNEKKPTDQTRPITPCFWD